MILLSLIFIRPFISSLAFPYLDLSYSCALLIFTVFWIVSKGISTDKIQAVKLPLILFCLALIISTTFSINKLISLNEILKYATYLSVFFVVSSLGQEQRIRLIKTITFAGLIISILAIYQYFFGLAHTLDYLNKEKIPDSFALDYITRKRAFLPFATPNALAGYLIMIIPLALIDKKRVWFIIPLSIALALTKSLGGVLSLFAVLTIGIIILLWRAIATNQSLRLLRSLRSLAMTAGLLLIAGFIIVSRYTNQSEHAQPLFSTLMRLNYWRDTLEIIKAHALTGIGPGNFNLAHSRYAHNSYLQIWAEMGILGIISILWLFIAVFKFCHHNPDLDPEGAVAKLATTCHSEAEGRRISSMIRSFPFSWLFVALLAFLCHNLFDFTFFLPEVAMLWWIILAYCLNKSPDKINVERNRKSNI